MMKQYEKANEDYQYACYMKSKSKGKLKKEFEADEDYAEYVMDSLAVKIKKLNPSKYILNKYPELQDIIESI